MDKTIIAHTAEEMEEIGTKLAESLTDGMLVSLIGPLGSGKTTLVKGIAKGLLITEVVVSPSYLLAREYQGRLTLHHLDAYRVSSCKSSPRSDSISSSPRDWGERSRVADTGRRDRRGE